MRLLLVIGLLLTASAPGLGAPDTKLAAPPQDVAWVPADAPAFVFVRLGEVWTHEATKELRERFAKAQPDFEKKFAEDVGLKPTEIERVIAIPQLAGSPDEMVFLLTTSKPARELIIAAGKTKHEEKKHNGRVYYQTTAEGPQGPGRTRALYEVNERFLVIGPTAAVLKLMDRAGKQEKNHPLADALKLTTGEDPVVVCCNLAQLPPEASASLPAEASALKPLFDAKPGLVTLRSGTETKLDLRLTYADETQAVSGEKALKAGMALAGTYLPVLREQVTKEAPGGDEMVKWMQGQMSSFLQATETSLKGSRVEIKGPTVSTQLRIKANVGAVAAMAGGFFWVRATVGPAPPEAVEIKKPAVEKKP
jgi:hypothetical protein